MAYFDIICLHVAKIAWFICTGTLIPLNHIKTNHKQHRIIQLPFLHLRCLCSNPLFVNKNFNVLCSCFIRSAYNSFMHNSTL